MSNSTVDVANFSISLPPEVFNISTDNNEAGLIFTSYRDTTLFQLTPPTTANNNFSDYNFTADSVVLGFALAGTEVRNLTNPVNITLQAQRALQGQVSRSLFLGTLSRLPHPPQNWSEPICVSWKFNSLEGKSHWHVCICTLYRLHKNVQFKNALIKSYGQPPLTSL